MKKILKDNQQFGTSLLQKLRNLNDMSNALSAFSIYEVLRIILPGLYFTSSLYRLSIHWNLKDIYVYKDIEFTFWYGLISLIMGLLIYSCDFPKRLSFMIRDLPTNVIKAKHPELDKITIYNNYFAFHDSITGEFKPKMESVSGYFHLTFNLTIVSVFVMALNCCYVRTAWDNLAPIITVFFISLLSTYLLYELRLKNFYQRSLKAYFASQIYNKINPTVFNTK